MINIAFFKHSTPQGNELEKLVYSVLCERFIDIVNIAVFDSAQISYADFIRIIQNTDIQILDGSIEPLNGELGQNYENIEPSFIYWNTFWIVSRNTLPINIIPQKSNINKFDSLRCHEYQLDGNNESKTDKINNTNIIEWIVNEILKIIPKNKRERIKNLENLNKRIKLEVNEAFHLGSSKKKKQTFLSFRGRYQNEKYFGYNIEDVVNEIKSYHSNCDEWEIPYYYESASLTEEFMPEQRIWAVHSFIYSKICECDEFWIFETDFSVDKNGNIISYSYWDSWWCVAEIMSLLKLKKEGNLNIDFKVIIFNPSKSIEQRKTILSVQDLPDLTDYEWREFRRLLCEGNIQLSNLHLRKDKLAFRKAPSFLKKIRYKILEKQWDFLKKVNGEDISIPYDIYVEDVNCRCYDDSFLTRRIFMNPSDIEIGRTREDVLKEGFCYSFLNLACRENPTSCFTGIYENECSQQSLKNAAHNNTPIILYGPNNKTIEVYIEEYGTMYYYWLPLHMKFYAKRKNRHTGPNREILEPIPLYRIIKS